MRTPLLIIVGAIYSASFCQTPKDSLSSTPLNEVIVSSQKTISTLETNPIQITNISAKEIEFENFQNTADALLNSGNLHVQKSQQGGGSPVIRGFEANRILLLVDGVRMNNLIFRAGHLQNVITVDENLLDNIEIFYGPSSTLFGSDALGGAVNLNTKNTPFSDNKKRPFNGNIASRYSSANQEKSTYFDLSFSGKNISTLTAFSYNNFGDLRMGKQKNHNGDYFGERPFYVNTNSNRTDYIVTNNNPLIQKHSGYEQYNLMQKINYKTPKSYIHGLNFQYSTTSDVPRYDRLTDPSSTTVLKNAEWYYGPQKRLLAIYSLNKAKSILKSDLNMNLAYQNVKESRNTRKFGNLNLEHNLENVNVFSLGLNLHRKLKAGEIFYGFESYYETLNSTAYSENITTGIHSSIATRYPNGVNNMSRNEIYLSYNGWNTKLFWNAGTRIGYTTLKSTIESNSIFTLLFNTVNQNNLTYSGTVGITHKTSKNITLKTNLSSGFRTPNIDDLAKVFDSGNGILIVPNTNLKPEKTITADLGINLKSTNSRFEINNTFYYTRLFDAIVTDTFTYNNQNTIVYNDEESMVYANQNKGKAFVTGFSTQLQFDITNTLKITNNFNYTFGRIIDSDNSKVPLDHIPPYYGKVGLMYHKKWATIEGYLLYNGKKDIEDYYPNGEDNERYTPEGGMPAWETYNLKTSFTVYKAMTLFTGVENILDTQYRVFASGINAPGRNIYAGLKCSF
jgi:hemoglobin/transferrin/lactoferrin receptor protein